MSIPLCLLCSLFFLFLLSLDLGLPFRVRSTHHLSFYTVSFFFRVSFLPSAIKRTALHFLSFPLPNFFSLSFYPFCLPYLLDRFLPLLLFALFSLLFYSVPSFSFFAFLFGVGELYHISIKCYINSQRTAPCPQPAWIYSG